MYTMAKYRRGRINDEMCRELAQAVRRVKDPRVSEAFISITGAEVSPDLKYAKIFYSALRGDPKETAKGLKSCAGFLRREIAQRMNLRITPELVFCFDQSITYGAHISKLLEQAQVPHNEDAEDADDIDGEDEDETEDETEDGEASEREL